MIYSAPLLEPGLVVPGPHFISDIRVSDLLAFVSVLVAAGALVTTWLGNRRLRRREIADRIRSAASTALSKIDRCGAIFLSFFDRIQPLITKMDRAYVRTPDAVAVRDMLWQSLHDERSAVRERFTAEEIELAYAPLLGHQAAIYDSFSRSIRSAEEEFDLAFNRFLSMSQTIVLALGDRAPVESALLGNELRALAALHRSVLAENLRIDLGGLRTALRSAIQLPDHAIIDRRAMLEAMAQAKAPEPAAGKIEYFFDESVLGAFIGSGKPQSQYCAMYDLAKAQRFNGALPRAPITTLLREGDDATAPPVPENGVRSRPKSLLRRRR